MDDQIKPLFELLKGQFGWAAATLAWMSAVRLALKPMSARIQAKIAERMVVASIDPLEAKDWEEVLQTRWYRVTAFFLDMIFSFKLPTHVEFERAMGGSGGTVLPAKAGGPGAALMLVVCAGILVGCGGAKLESGGAYAPTGTNGVAMVEPDMGLFLIDSAYKLAWGTINAVFETEADNRALLLQVSPSIKQSLDEIRPLAWEADTRFHAAREVYKANPTPSNLDALHAVLAELQRVTTSAQAALPQFENPKGN